jgi:hypothetical protein
MTRYQELKPTCQVDLNFAHALSEANRVPLLSLHTHTDFKNLSTFREQVKFLQGELRHFTANLFGYRDLAKALSWQVGSIEFQMSWLDGPIRPNGWSRLPTAEAYLRINKVESEGVKREEPVSMPYFLNRLNCYLRLTSH